MDRVTRRGVRARLRLCYSARPSGRLRLCYSARPSGRLRLCYSARPSRRLRLCYSARPSRRLRKENIVKTRLAWMWTTAVLFASSSMGCRIHNCEHGAVCGDDDDDEARENSCHSLCDRLTVCGHLDGDSYDGCVSSCYRDYDRAPHLTSEYCSCMSRASCYEIADHRCPPPESNSSTGSTAGAGGSSSSATTATTTGAAGAAGYGGQGGSSGADGMADGGPGCSQD